MSYPDRRPLNIPTGFPGFPVYLPPATTGAGLTGVDLLVVHPQDMPPAPFDNEIGLTYTELSADGVTAQLAVKPSLLQPMGIVHGGVWCAMVESMASVSAFLWLSSNGGGGGGGGGNVVGVNNSTDFLRAITEGTVFGRSEPIHRGRTQQLWLVTIRDDAERLVARGQVRLQNLEARQ